MADSPSLAGRPIKRFFRLLAPDSRAIVYVYLYAIFLGLINLSLPLGIQAIIGLTLADEISASWIILIVVVTLGTAFAGFLQIMQITITEMLQQRVFVRASFEFVYRLPRLQMDALTRYYPPELVNRFFDVVNVQKGLPKLLIDFTTALLQIFFGLVLLAFYNTAFIAFGLVLAFLLFVIIRVTGPKGLRTSLEESNYKYEVAYWLEEVARTLKTFKLAGPTNLPLDRVDGLVKSYVGARKSHFRVLVQQISSAVAFKTVVTAGLLILGSVLLIERQINLGQFVASEIVIILIINSVEKLLLSADTIYDVLTALEKIAKVTDLPLEAERGAECEQVNPGPAISVRAQDLSYTWPGDKTPSLNGIDFEIEAGEKVCFIGKNGSGKSLMLNVISVIYDGFEGSLSYNGLPLRSYELASLRASIGDILSQKVLFRGTIEDNITIGRRDVEPAEVRLAIQAVGLQSFIESLPYGAQTMFTPETPRFPDSVLSKISVARAIVRSPKIIVADDLFETLDLKERRQIVELLVGGPWTLLITGHDPVVAQACDRVIVLEKGKVVDTGTYESLRHKPEYAELFGLTSEN